jgi:hypothetical protein
MQFEQAMGTSREELEKLTFFNVIAKEELQDAFSTVAYMLQGLKEESCFTRLLEARPGRPVLYITISLVKEGTAPKFFSCSVHG